MTNLTTQDPRFLPVTFNGRAGVCENRIEGELLI